MFQSIWSVRRRNMLFRVLLLLSLVGFSFLEAQEVVLDSIPLDEARFHGEVQECDPEFCWKNCRCQSEATPGNLDISDLPQFVLINFQGEINEKNLALIHLLLTDTVGLNPSTQCPIRGTIFAQGVDADYMLLNHLYNAGNEIGSLGLSSDPEHETYNWKRWQEEFVFHRRIISLMANINFEDIRVARSPWMDPQGDQMLSGLDTEKNPNENMADASFTSFSPTWPYTMDFIGQDEECLHPPCRTKAFKGMWEMPMYAFETLDGHPCLFVDECPLDQESSEFPLRDFLMRMFRSESYFGGSRYPFIMNFKNISFLEEPHHFRQIYDLLQGIQLSGVHVVTMSELLEWTRKPVRLDQLVETRSDQCSRNSSQITACRGKACYYLHDHKHIRSLNCLGQCVPVLPAHYNAKDVYSQILGGGGFHGPNPSFEARLKAQKNNDFQIELTKEIIKGYKQLLHGRKPKTVPNWEGLFLPFVESARLAKGTKRFKVLELD